MVLTIWDLIKAVYKHKFAIIAVTLAAFVCSYLYIDRHQSYTAQTVVEYKDACIKEGKSLDGETFDVYEMISPSVISDVIDDLSLNHSVESIRSQITIEPIVPDSQTVIKEATEEEGEEYTYYPTSYVVSFEATTAFTYAEARDILDSLIQNYLTYYTEKYLNLATLQEIDYGMENADYDYIEKAEILRDNINATVDTLSSYSNASSSFRSTSTGYTFNDISKEFNHLSSFNLPMIFSEIYKGQVTKNKSLLIDKYTEKKEQYELTAKNMTDKANLAEDRMNSFAAANADTTVTDGDGSGNDAYIIDGVYGNDENYNYNEQTTYDELIENYVNYSITANNNTIDAQYCQNIIDIFSAEPEEGVDSAEYTKSVDEKITETSAELKELYNSTYNAIDDYNQYIAAQHMSFLTGVQYYENINTLVLSLLALILGFGFSVIFAIALEILRKYKKYTASHMRANGISVEYEDEEDEEDEEDAKKKKRRMRFFGIDEDLDGDGESENDKDDEALNAFSGADNSASVGEAVPKTDEDDLESEAAEINTEIEVPKIDTDDEAVETAAEDDSKGTDMENEAVETAAEDEAEENAAEDEPAEGDTSEQPSDEIIPDTVNYMSEGIDVKNAVISAKKPKKSIFGRIAATIGIVVLAIIVLAAIFTGYIYLDNNRVENVEYTYVSDKVTDAFDGFKIALVTDYHNSDMVDKTVEAIKSGNPDIICIGGDLVDLDTQDFTNALEFVEKLTEIAPVYYEYGNHEIWSNNINETEEPIIREKLKDLDVIFLNDETVKIEKNGDYFYLTGFEDLKYDDLQSGDVYTSVLEDRMAQLSKNVDEDKLSVLLFHRANYFDTVSKYPFDLVLSGHIHAGQIGIPMLAQKVVDKHLGGSKYIVGEYEENGNSMIVSGGIGETYDIPRILCAPQVVTVTLTKSAAGASESEETEDSASETSTPDASESEITEDSASETSTPDTSEQSETSSPEETAAPSETEQVR